jgi:ABC-type phosphate transport system ATPase subunit
VGLLLGGQLVEVAPTRTFFEAPSDARTAEFVQGKMIY